MVRIFPFLLLIALTVTKVSAGKSDSLGTVYSIDSVIITDDGESRPASDNLYFKIIVGLHKSLCIKKSVFSVAPDQENLEWNRPYVATLSDKQIDSIAAILSHYDLTQQANPPIIDTTITLSTIEITSDTPEIILTVFYNGGIKKRIIVLNFMTKETPSIRASMSSINEILSNIQWGRVKDIKQYNELIKKFHVETFNENYPHKN